MPRFRIGPSKLMLGQEVNYGAVQCDRDFDNPWIVVTNLTKKKTLIFKIAGAVMYLLDITENKLHDILLKVESPVILGKDNCLYYIRYMNANRFVACTTEEFLSYYPDAPDISKIPYQRCFSFTYQIAKFLNREKNMALGINIALTKPGAVYTGAKKDPPKPWWPNTWLHKPLNQFDVATTQTRNSAHSRCNTYWIYRFEDEDPNKYERGDRLVERLMQQNGVEIPWDTNYFYCEDIKKE